MRGAEQTAPTDRSPFARKAEAERESGARGELPALLRELVATTSETVKREARDAFEGERESIRAYVDRQMAAQFGEQLRALKLQLSTFVRDFVEVKSAETLGLSLSRESLRVEGASLGAERCEAALARLSARVAEQNRLIAALFAENAALGELLAAQTRQIDELRASLAGDAELNGLFGDDANVSIIKQSRDDTVIDWLAAEIDLGKDSKRLCTTLSTNARVVSLGNSPVNSGEKLRIGRARLESLFPEIEWANASDGEFDVDANGEVSDARGDSVFDRNGKAVKIDRNRFAKISFFNFN